VEKRQKRVPAKKPVKESALDPDRKAELVEAGGRIAAQLAQGETRALLFIRALAMTPLPRNSKRERLIIKVARIGRDEWIRTKFSVDEEGRKIIFGADLLRLMSLLTLMWETKRIRFEFRNLQELWGLMEQAGIGARGGHSDSELREAFQRLADTAMEIRTYRTEADARLDRNHQSQIKVNFIRHSSLPTRSETKREEQGETPLFSHFIEASRDLQEMVAAPKNHVWAHEEVLHRFAGDPLKLRFALLVLTRAQATKTAAEMSHEELMEAFKEGTRDRDLMTDLRNALAELQTLTGNSLRVRFLEVIPARSGKRGRPSARWSLRFDPGSRILTMKPNSGRELDSGRENTVNR
jgi:hypothetical protein